MSKSAKELYTVPEWMRPYLTLFQNTGGNDVEDLLHDEDTNMFANSIRYMLIMSARSQFGLLMDMYKNGQIIELETMKTDPVGEDYQSAIDILRDRAARELDGGFRSHHNALIYAANELENAQAFGREVSHES